MLDFDSSGRMNEAVAAQSLSTGHLSLIQRLIHTIITRSALQEVIHKSESLFHQALRVYVRQSSRVCLYPLKCVVFRLFVMVQLPELSD